MHGIIQLALRHSTGGVKSHRAPGNQRGALHNGNLPNAIGQTLGQQSGVVLYGFGEGLVFQPHSGKDVARLENEKGVESNRLQTGGVEQGQIQTGPHFLLDHRIAKTDTLSHRLKAGRRNRIDQVLLLHGGIDGRGLQTYPVWIFPLIGVQRGIAGPLFQKISGPGRQFGHLRVVRGDEGRDQLRIIGRTMPLIEGQRSQRSAIFCQQFAIAVQLQHDLSTDSLGQAGEKGAIGLDSRSMKHKVRLGRHTFNHLPEGQQDLWSAAHRE